MSLQERLRTTGPKRILALDGGGIRGLITLGFLARIEKVLREHHDRPSLVLADYFDLIGGTSTGSIIAAALAKGMSVADIRALYLEVGEKAFATKTRLLDRLRADYDAKPVEAILRANFPDFTLGDDRLRTGLCIVAKRADTNSTWAFHNHPDGRYFGANAALPLWQVIRASTAAPTYFKPESIALTTRDGKRLSGTFVDGGVSMAVNPALLLFQLATIKAYPFRWPTGDDRLLLVSVGTGSWPADEDPGVLAQGTLLTWAKMIPGMLMDDSSAQAQLMLQWLSRTPTPWLIDREVGELHDDLLTPEPLLSYLRYDARIEPEALSLMGFDDYARDARSLREMDNAALRDAFDAIGKKAAERTLANNNERILHFGVEPGHFPPAFDLVGSQ